MNRIKIKISTKIKFYRKIFVNKLYNVVFMQKILTRLTIILSLSSFSLSCKEEARPSIPSCEVYIEVSRSSFPNDYAKLQNPNSAVSYIYTPGVPMPANFKYGYGGVLIFRDLDGKIRSCDLACPVEASRTVRVEVNMPFAVCPVCNSKFDLSHGFASPTAGPAKESLRIYSNVFERANSIVVSN